LVGWWRAEGDATDSSVSGNDGTLVGDATYAAGQFGQAFSLDGTGDHVLIGDCNEVSFGSDDSFTWSAWVYKDTDQEGDIIWKGTYLRLRYQGSRWEFRFGNQSSYTWVYLLDGSPSGQWTHLAAVYDASTQMGHLYVDGSFPGEGASHALAGEFDNAESLKFGSGNTAHDGLIDDVMIFKRALDENEIAALYDATAGLGASMGPLPEMVQYGYTIYAVNDAAETDTETGSIMVDVANSAPTGAVSSPISPRRTDQTTVTFTGTAADTNGDTTLALATLWWDVGQDSGVLVSSGLTDTLSGNADTWSITAAGLSTGTITWNLKLRDSAGNEDFISGTSSTLIIGQSMFYVATDGNDDNPGTLVKPFLTIQRFADTAYPGDTCYIRAGTYRETVTPVRSGTADANIVFAAYNDEPVIVSGADPVSGDWHVHSGSVYKTTAMNWDLGEGLNQVFVDGVAGRWSYWPNCSDVMRPTLLEPDSITIAGSTLTINDAGNLTQDSGYWNGAIIHANWGGRYHAGTAAVTSSTPGRLVATMHCTPAAGTSYPVYYLMGCYNGLDEANEWFYDSDTSTLYLWAPGGGSPTGVEAKARQYAFDLSGRSYIQIRDIGLFAATIVTDDESEHIAIDSISARYVSHYAKIDEGGMGSGEKGTRDSGIILNGRHNAIRNSSVLWSAGNGVALLGDSCTVVDCEIQAVNYMASDCAAVHTGGLKTQNNVVSDCTLHNVGREMIVHSSAQNMKILRNEMYDNRPGMIVWDLGATYCIATDGKGTEIAYNLIHDIRSKGIYFDYSTANMRVHHNVIYDVNAYPTKLGIHFNQPAVGHTVCHNTFPDSKVSSSTAFGSGMTGTHVENNIAWQVSGSYPGDATISNNLTINTPDYCDPQTLFVDPSGHNYRLLATGAAVNAGQDLGFTHDIEGHPIVGAPDIGAYEYSGVPVTYTLSVSSEHGSVSRVPDSIEYASGSAVTLEATPVDGYSFVSWSGDLAGGSNPATVVMDGNKSVTANFAADTYDLNVIASGGSVSRSPDKASYAYGDVVTLQAAADTGYTFSNWSGDASGTSSSVQITMNADKSVTANFTANSYTLAVAATGGSVVADPQKASYSYGETVSLQAVPGTGYHFTGWSGDLSGTGNPSTLVMNGDKSVTADFAINTYALNVSAVNGSITKSPDQATYNYGQTVSLQAVAAAGYEFAGWSGAISGTSNPTSVVMDGVKSVTASFSASTYALSISAVNGSVTKDPDLPTYTHGQTVALTAVADTGYSFSGWSGDASGTAVSTTITMNDDKSVTAGFTINAYTLDVSAANGSVTKDPDLPTYTHGQTVALTAVADTGYSFSGWSGDASGTSVSTTITMNDDKSVTAGFTINTYTLSVAATEGSVTKSPDKASYTHGETVTLEATPSVGYNFVSWAGDLAGGSNPAALVMDGDKSVTASFAASTYTLETIAVNGSVTRSPDKASFTHGETVTLTAAADTGYTFSGWSGDASGTSVSTVLTMDGNKSVTAGFTINTYTLTLAATEGSVTKSPDKASYTHGESVTLQATPSVGYNFVSWTGDLAGGSNPAALVMNGNKSVTASFAANTYVLETTAANGSITKDPDQATYTHGQAVTVTAVADTGYTFSAWSGDASGTVVSTTVTMDGDKSVTASFTLNSYTLTLEGLNGSVLSVPTKDSYAHGESVSLSATPAVGYHFTGWSGDATGDANPLSLVMDADKSVTANFTINACILDVTALNGSVARIPEKDSYDYGETVNLLATAASGYEFTGWSGDLAGASNPQALVMTGDKTVTANFTAESDDQEAPVLYGASPAGGAIQAPLNSLVLLHVSDAGEGVDANTVGIEVNGESVYAGDVASYTSSSGVCRRAGTKADYTYAYQAADDFDYDAAVTVTVNAADLEGNAMAQQSYSFRTQMRAFGANRCASWGPTGVDRGGAATVSDASGNLWVVYHAGAGGARDIYVAERTAGTEQFADPMQVTNNVLDQCNPDIAVGTDGRFYVVWQDNRRGNWDIYVSTSADGAVWSAPVRVAESDYDEVRPAIAVDSQSPNRAYVTWQDNRAGNQDVYVSSSNNGFVSKTVQAVTSHAQNQTEPRIAVDGSNTVYIVWTDDRNGATDIYGAASNSGPWSNVRIAGAAGNQFSPVVAAEPGGSVLHLAWVSDLAGNEDICYGVSNGLPASPLTAVNIIDDTSEADQGAPAIAVAGGAGAARVFVCWQDARNTANNQDMDIYAAEIKVGDETNLLVGDGGTSTYQSEPAMGVDLHGRPYVVWTDGRNATDQVYFAASTFVEPTPLDERLISSAVGGTVGAVSPVGEDDVSVVIPAGACPYDVTISVARIQDLQPGSSVSVLPYEFGPSGLQFDAPVTITMPYLLADYGTNPPQPYWYDTLTGTLTQQGITDIEHLTLSTTLGALRFQTTHFTTYALVATEHDEATVPVSSGGGGGCSVSSGTGEYGALEFSIPYVLLAVVVTLIRLSDRRRHRALVGTVQDKRK